MKKFMMIAAMVVATMSANAQSRFEPGTLTVQPRLGGTGAMFTNAPDIDMYGIAEFDATATGGAFIGADMEYQLTNRFSVAAGVNWAQAGSGWKDKDISYEGKVLEISDFKVETSYVRVPLTVNFYLLKGFAIKSGVQFGFLTSAKLKATEEQDISGGGKKKTEYDKDCKDSFKKFDLSIPVGLSYEFKVPIVIDLRYNIGLTKVNKESNHNLKDSRNLVCDLTVGYKFKL